MIKNLLTNWRTTSIGLSIVIGATVHLVFMVKSGAADETTWNRSLIEIAGGFGLMFAGDAAKSVTKADAETSFLRKEDVKTESKTAAGVIKEDASRTTGD